MSIKLIAFTCGNASSDKIGVSIRSAFGNSGEHCCFPTGMSLDEGKPTFSLFEDGEVIMADHQSEGVIELESDRFKLHFVMVPR